MIDYLLAHFGPWGVLFLSVFALSYGASHILLVLRHDSYEFYSKVLGFVSLIIVFIVSGWRAGLLGFAIGFVVSLFGALVARFLRQAQERAPD